MGKNITKLEQADFELSLFRPLLEIPKPPACLFIRGEVEKYRFYKKVCVVGSRMHSSYAKQVVDTLCRTLAEHSNIIIISGLALGIDGLAHQSALRHKIPTLAVLGSDLNAQNIYPRSHVALGKEIISAGGALVSEYNEQKAMKWTFPARNRIMAGMSDLVIVVEAGEKSGTLVTAKLAMECGTDVAIVPNSIFSEFSRGSNKLIRDGAHVITDMQDILDLLHITSDSNKSNQSYEDLDKNEVKILSLLSEPLSRDTLLQKSSLSSSELSRLLSILEIKGYIKEELGLIFRK